MVDLQWLYCNGCTAMVCAKCVRKMCTHTQPEGGAGRVAGDVIVVLGADRPVSGQAGSSLVEDVGHVCTGQTLFYKMFYEIPQIYMIPQMRSVPHLYYTDDAPRL